MQDEQTRASVLRIQNRGSGAILNHESAEYVLSGSRIKNRYCYVETSISLLKLSPNLFDSTGERK